MAKPVTKHYHANEDVGHPDQNQMIEGGHQLTVCPSVSNDVNAITMVGCATPRGVTARARPGVQRRGEGERSALRIHSATLRRRLGGAHQQREKLGGCGNVKP